MQNVTTNSELFSDNRFHSSGQSSPGGIHILLEDKNVKNIRTFVLGLCLLTAFSVSAFAQQKSLYERLGGKEAISAVVDDFAGNVLADPRINKKFAKSDPARLLANLKDFVCFATGGPCRYSGLSMKESHKNMGTTAGEFTALVEDLVKTLNKFNVGAVEQKELLTALAGLRNDIVESESNATGGDLPANFKPAPPLAEKGAPVASAPAAPASSKSLFDRLGGKEAISAVVDDFAGNVLNDARINKKFAKSNAPRLLANLKDFVCFATGGPCKYTGLSMKESHKNMGSTAGEFNALVEDLIKTLNKFNVGQAEQKELLNALAGLRGDIVENESAATGTPLPANFKPAPPLGAPATTTAAAPSRARTGSLFERLGGMQAISAVVDDFAGNVLADTRINKKFAKSDAPRLLANLKDFVCFATGGPCQYKGLSMKKAHEHMRVTGGEFNALVEDLVKTLDKFNVVDPERKELLTALAGLRGDIVRDKYDTSETGTPLGPSFKPAPPLGVTKGKKAMKNAKDE